MDITKIRLKMVNYKQWRSLWKDDKSFLLYSVLFLKSILITVMTVSVWIYVKILNKSRFYKWASHVVIMENRRDIFIILTDRHHQEALYTCRWDENIRMNLKKTGIYVMKWELCRCQAAVDTALNPWVQASWLIPYIQISTLGSTIRQSVSIEVICTKVSH
jgi:hypothetical protein